MEGLSIGQLQTAGFVQSPKGIFVVASAGNDGPRCSSVSAPIAIYQDAFSVGAIDQLGNLGSFSSVGPVTVDGSGRLKPEILAPGVSVLSALPNNTYGSLDGTAMAGPHVAGVVALMWSANPALIGDIARTRQILEQSATPFREMPDPTGGATQQIACLLTTDLTKRPNQVAGYGIVNAYAAVQQAQAAK